MPWFHRMVDQAAVGAAAAGLGADELLRGAAAPAGEQGSRLEMSGGMGQVDLGNLCLTPAQTSGQRVACSPGGRNDVSEGKRFRGKISIRRGKICSWTTELQRSVSRRFYGRRVFMFVA